MWSSSVDGLLAAETGANLGGKPNSQNFLIHWDGDESRELESGTAMREFRWRHARKLRLVCGEQTAYSQPPHVGFRMGRGMVTPPKPDIHVR